MSTIGIGFIGLGEHQIRAHVIHLHNMKTKGFNIELQGYFDPNQEAHDELPKRIPDIPSYGSIEALLADPKIDVVYIASPDMYHAEQLLAAVKAGKHVFCEKPVAVHDTQMNQMYDAIFIAEEKGLIISTCHPRRLDPPCIWIKNEMPNFKAKYGELKHFDFSFWYHEVTDVWKKTERTLLTDHFGHEIDIIRFLLGNSDLEIAVTADSFDFYETTGLAGGGPSKYGGYSFRFCGSRNLEESVYEEAIRLDFEKASVLMHLNKGTGVVFPEATTFAFPAIDYDQRFMATNMDFILAVMGQGTSYLTFDDIICNNRMTVRLAQFGKAKHTE